jgi:putative spermidine/putrescine transport system permease protein
MKKGNLILTLFVTIVFLFLMSPSIILVFSSFTTTRFVTFPPEGFTLEWYINIANFPEFFSSILTSLLLASAVTIFALILGILASFAIVRHRFPGRDLLNTFFLSPLSLPWIITAIALLVFYSQVVRVETLIGLIIGHLIVSTPFVIRSVVSSLTGFDITLEEASANLGANEIRTFFRSHII